MWYSLPHRTLASVTQVEVLKVLTHWGLPSLELGTWRSHREKPRLAPWSMRGRVERKTQPSQLLSVLNVGCIWLYYYSAMVRVSGQEMTAIGKKWLVIHRSQKTEHPTLQETTWGSTRVNPGAEGVRGKWGKNLYFGFLGRNRWGRVSRFKMG